MMSAELANLQKMLIESIKLSMQGAYHRRAPAKASLPYLQRARTGLEEYLLRNPHDVLGWRLLSQAEESLLDYRGAIMSFEKAMSLLGRRNKTDLKRLALLNQSLAEWDALPLSPQQLRELGDFLTTAGVDAKSDDRSMPLTKRWLEETKIALPDKVVQALNSRGAYSDFQVLCNIVLG